MVRMTNNCLYLIIKKWFRVIPILFFGMPSSSLHSRYIQYKCVWGWGSLRGILIFIGALKYTRFDMKIY